MKKRRDEVVDDEFVMNLKLDIMNENKSNHSDSPRIKDEPYADLKIPVLSEDRKFENMRQSLSSNQLRSDLNDVNKSLLS